MSAAASHVQPFAPSPGPSGTGERALPLAGGGELTLTDTPRLMGIVNITPDSFSDGGRWLDAEAAIRHGRRLAAEGADLLDLGAESTRPGGGVYGAGAREVPAAEELERLLPVLEGLAGTVEIPISVDTRKAEVAAAALAAGATLVNDISGLEDPEMAAVVVEYGAAIVLMHSRGPLATMQREVVFEDLLSEVSDDLLAKAERALAAGIDRERIVLDPGLGFGKRAGHNLQLLRRLDRLAALGYPLLVGASRKSFVGALTGAGVDDRLGGSLAAAAWGAHHRVAILRVHDVAASRQFLDVWSAIERSEAAP